MQVASQSVETVCSCNTFLFLEFSLLLYSNNSVREYSKEEKIRDQQKERIIYFRILTWAEEIK